MHAADGFASFIALASTLLLLAAAKRHWMPGRGALRTEPFLHQLSLSPLWCASVPSVVLTVVCFVQMQRLPYKPLWATTMLAFYVSSSVLLWMVGQRCFTWRTSHFAFTFQRDRYDAASFHVRLNASHLQRKLRGGRSLGKREVVLFLAEIELALAQARAMPKAVTKLTVSSPWFGHGRHAAMLASLGQMLERVFPHARVVPVVRQRHRVSTFFLRLLSPLARRWHTSARGRGIVSVGFEVVLDGAGHTFGER